MSRDVEFVKEQVTKIFRKSNSKAGHVLNENVVRNQKLDWNPKQQNALKAGLDELVSEKIIERRENGFFLTERGEDTIYPEIGNSVRDGIFDFLAKNRVSTGERVDSILDLRAFFVTHYEKWNPKQQNAYHSVLDELIAEEIFEKVDKEIRLTEKGYNKLY